MKHNDLCTITRTSTVKDPATHIAKTQITTLGPYKCRLGRASGNLVQMQPQEAFTQQLRLYIPDIKSDIKPGDIATVDTSNYIVGNIYKSNKHHIEADVTYKKEV